MSDIVRRLRNGIGNTFDGETEALQTMEEAANEIDRLRALTICDGCGKQVDENGPCCEPCFSKAIVAHIKPIAAERDRLRAEVAKRQWQPIETAPKDGSGILVYRPNATNTGREIGRDVWCKTCWWYSRADEQPSHWVPLPDPPQETEG